MMVKLAMMLGMSFVTSNGPIKCHQVANVALARSTSLKIMHKMDIGLVSNKKIITPKLSF
jgi:hypothetical protein